MSEDEVKDSEEDDMKEDKTPANQDERTGNELQRRYPVRIRNRPRYYRDEAS